MRDRLAKFMKNEGLSSSRFAEILGVPPSSISHLLAGRNKPGFDFLAKMTQRFPRLNPDWLLLGTGPIYRPTAGATMPVEIPTVPVATSVLVNPAENRAEPFVAAMAREEPPYETLDERAERDLFGISHEEIEEQVDEDIEREASPESCITEKPVFPKSAPRKFATAIPTAPKPAVTQRIAGSEEIARIIICYTDGTFENLAPKNGLAIES